MFEMHYINVYGMCEAFGACLCIKSFATNDSLMHSIYFPLMQVLLYQPLKNVALRSKSSIRLFIE